MKIRMLKVFVLITMLLSVQTLSAQVKYSLVQDKSTMQVEGTSSVHDWEMDAGGLTCNMLATTKNNKVIAIDEVAFSCVAEKILSDNSIMDGKTHDALKAEDYPKITFKMKSMESVNQSGDKFSGEMYGVVEIAGVSKNIKVKFSGSVIGGDALQVTGSVPLKMSDFNMEPPTAMFGALKTGNEVKVNYDLHMKRN